MSDQTKLEPCPFCGDAARFVREPSAGGLHDWWFVECAGGKGVDCAARSQGFGLKIHAAQAWNRRAPIAADTAPESKLASIERPEGIPNLPSPGWHEAIEEAANVADKVSDKWEAERQRHTGKLSKETRTCCTFKHDGAREVAFAIRSLLPPGGEGA